jgi:hypothetical protein
MSIFNDLKQLEELWVTSRELMRQAYVAKFAFRKAQKDLKSRVKGDAKKYWQIARKVAKKNKPRGRGIGCHIISVYAGFILGIPPEEVSRSSNLELTTKVLNNKKGLKSDWSRFAEIFPEYIHILSNLNK